MWCSTVGLVNCKHRYLTAETFGFKINSKGQAMKKKQQWTIEPFPELPVGAVPPLATTGALISGDSNGGISTQRSTSTSLVLAASGELAADSCNEEHENVAIKSHLDKYLAVDSFGNVTCDSIDKTELARFTITICSMSTASDEEQIFWAFKNVGRGYYLGTTDDGMICCSAKMPKSRAELWHLHLIPARGASLFALRSLGRKRYARVANLNGSDDDDESNGAAAASPLSVANRQADARGQLAGEQVQLDATACWGAETLFQLRYFEGGQYSLLTSDCRLVTNKGRCIDWPPSQAANDSFKLVNQNNSNKKPPAECLFTLEYHSGFVALRDSFSLYLAAAGCSSVLRSRSEGISRDELFSFEPPTVQVALKALFNNKWVSTRQGVDVSANQSLKEPSMAYETFQLTHYQKTYLWDIATHDCRVWTVAPNSSTVSVCKQQDLPQALQQSKGSFRIVWSATEPTCSIKFVDSLGAERWICSRKSGQLFVATNGEPVRLSMRLQNRRVLNLRPETGSGFVGLKSSGIGRNQLEANKTSPDQIAVEYFTSAAFASAQQPVSAGTTGVKLELRSDGELELDGKCVDTNNNTNINNSKPPHEAQVASVNGQAKSQQQSPLGAGSSCNVESSATPSVASIISSLSNAAIQQARSQPNGSSSNLAPVQLGPSQQSKSVLKHCELFESKLSSPLVVPKTRSKPLASNGNCNDSILDASSECSNQSTAAAIDAVSSDYASGGGYQLELCYLKTICNNRYLLVDDSPSRAIVCDALANNRGAAQSWCLELRSHNALSIRASDSPNCYVNLGPNGAVALAKCEPSAASLWEF